MPFPLAALAIMAGAKAVGGLMKKKGAAKQAKEASRSEQANLDAKFASDTSAFDNRENDRLARTQGIAQQLTGARGLSPEVIAAAMQRRKNTAFRGDAADRSKGAGWDMVGGLADQAGDMAGAYVKGSQMNDDPGSSATRVIGAPAPCPPGTQGSDGECY
jgi:hypothetical protein